MQHKSAPRVLKKRDPDLYEVVKGAMVRGIRHRYLVLQDDKEQLQKARKRLVERGVRPVAGGKRVKLCDVWESTYNTQGFGARHYAEGRAKLNALEATAHGVRTEIETTVTKFDRGVSWMSCRETATFTVWAFVAEDFDIEIIKDCPKLDLRSAVKASWGMGVNPRVFNPFLPHGYEESVGLDYFGGETRKASGA